MTERITSQGTPYRVPLFFVDIRRGYLYYKEYSERGGAPL